MTYHAAVSDLGVSIKDGEGTKWVVRHLSFGAGPGDVIGLAGASGSGKTTVLMCLAGVTRHQEGQVMVSGQHRQPGELAKPRHLRQIGVVFQDYHLVQSLDALDNVALPLKLDGLSWRKARASAAVSLGLFGLRAAMFRYPAQLSGGEQQRVAIARAMVRQPPVLLCDEPTAHLDADSTGIVVDALADLASLGTSVVVASHDPRLLRELETVIDLAAGATSAAASTAARPATAASAAPAPLYPGPTLRSSRPFITQLVKDEEEI